MIEDLNWRVEQQFLLWVVKLCCSFSQIRLMTPGLGSYVKVVRFARQTDKFILVTHKTHTF